MTFSDTEKIKRLAHTFDLNYRVTQLYATYIEHFPEVITSDMVNALTEDGKTTKSEAVAAIVSELFSLDYSSSESDRKIIRDYIRPSIRILDTKKYTENKYYKNIKIDNIKDGEWELREQSYEPYRAVIAGDLIIKEDFSEIPPLGFFIEKFYFPAVLENGNEWMTLTPVDLDTCEDAINSAHGDVITFGLGLGYFAYMASEKEDVKSVTIIEKSENVVRLFNNYILHQFSHPEKIKIIIADAFWYAEFEMPKMKYDYAFVDTWRDASDGAPMYKKMKSLEEKNIGVRFDYWIESFLVSRLRALKFEELYKKVMRNESDAPKTYDEFIMEL